MGGKILSDILGGARPSPEEESPEAEAPDEVAQPRSSTLALDLAMRTCWMTSLTANPWECISWGSLLRGLKKKAPLAWAQRTISAP